MQYLSLRSLGAEEEEGVDGYAASTEAFNAKRGLKNESLLCEFTVRHQISNPTGCLVWEVQHPDYSSELVSYIIFDICTFIINVPQQAPVIIISAESLGSNRDSRCPCSQQLVGANSDPAQGPPHGPPGRWVNYAYWKANPANPLAHTTSFNTKG